MGIGVSIVVFAIGAILKFGVTTTAPGLDLDAIGVILMVVGIVGLLISSIFLMTWSPWYYRRSAVPIEEPHEHVHDHRVA